MTRGDFYAQTVEYTMELAEKRGFKYYINEEFTYDAELMVKTPARTRLFKTLNDIAKYYDCPITEIKDYEPLRGEFLSFVAIPKKYLKQ